MMKEIKRINTISLALVSGMVHSIIVAIFGFIMLIIPAVASMISLAAVHSEMAGLFAYMVGYGLVMGIFIWVIAVIISFAAGFVFGGLFGIIYNFVASRIGGVKVELKDVQE
ncbi:hypothetical protein [Methanocaldococcus sp.]